MEASKTKLGVKILCIILIMPTFVFLNVALFDAVHQILVNDNVLMHRGYFAIMTLVWGVHSLGIANLFAKGKG
ncbi:hypothetical protein Dalk_0346 [Desulfatibacillum aliphaticivorans]|uniref:Uncharacterized protein n=1 Tax=Desulfatibacillum aliphaticivorans TaxID=218208 RepID=B8F923_DESAL|nr:hypothetical protein Dalk_0346 [Desulfatibacillum aliphaticivorans]